MQQNNYPGQWPVQRSGSGGYHGPPPAKKARAGSATALNTTVTTNGTVITKYAPPPGYAPPVPPPTHHQAAPWQQSAQGSGYPPAAYPGFHQPYAQPQQQPPYQAGYQAYPVQSTPTQGYPAQSYQPTISHPQGQPGSQGFHAPSYTASSHGRNASIPHLPRPNSLPSNPYHQNNAQQYPPQQSTRQPSHAQYNGPQHNGSQQYGHQDDQFPPAYLDESYPSWFSEVPLGKKWPTPIEGDFHDDCHYAEHPEEIVPELSIGMIETHYALPTKRPIPSTFQEAELEALAPRKQDPTEEESISRYYIDEKVDEQLNTVRYSSTWAEVKDDMIFREFSANDYPTITIDVMINNYRRQVDRGLIMPNSPSPLPTPALRPIPEDTDANGGAMDLDHDSSAHASRRGSRQPGGGSDDPLHNLELALQQTRPASRPMSSASRHSRASSVASGYSERIARPKQLPKINDSRQDEILRMLGVEGSPQAVYETPGPAFGPRPSSTHSNHSSHHSRHNSVGGAHQSRYAPPPPHAQSNATFNDPWSQANSAANGHNGHRPTSASSHHTQAGSDFHHEDMDATPRPRYNRTDSRKRSFHEEDYAPGDRDDFTNDETPKQRYKQARVAPDMQRRLWQR